MRYAKSSTLFNAKALVLWALGRLSGFEENSNPLIDIERGSAGGEGRERSCGDGFLSLE
jgi:hypothetical protein